MTLTLDVQVSGDVTAAVTIGGLAVVGAVAATRHCRLEGQYATLDDCGVWRALAEPPEHRLRMSAGVALDALGYVINHHVDHLLRYRDVLRWDCVFNLKINVFNYIFV